MQVSNMRNSRGNEVPNQVIISGITTEYTTKSGEKKTTEKGSMYQSYNSNIVFETESGEIFIDSRYWNYSVTTNRYRNQFLNENKAETQKKIDSGEYKLVDLN